MCFLKIEIFKLICLLDGQQIFSSSIDWTPSIFEARVGVHSEIVVLPFSHLFNFICCWIDRETLAVTVALRSLRLGKSELSSRWSWPWVFKDCGWKRQDTREGDASSINKGKVWKCLSKEGKAIFRRIWGEKQITKNNWGWGWEHHKWKEQELGFILIVLSGELWANLPTSRTSRLLQPLAAGTNYTMQTSQAPLAPRSHTWIAGRSLEDRPGGVQADVLATGLSEGNKEFNLKVSWSQTPIS